MQVKALQPVYKTGKTDDNGGYSAATVRVKPEFQGRYKITDQTLPLDNARKREREAKKREVEVEIDGSRYHALLPIADSPPKKRPTDACLYIPSGGYFEEMYIPADALEIVETAGDKVVYTSWFPMETICVKL